MSIKSQPRLRLLFPVLLILFLGGCWDQVEIKERTIVIGLGIDKISGSEPILLTAQVINTNASKGGLSGAGGGGTRSSEGSAQSGDSVVVETSTGRSFDDAIHNFLKYSSRRITFTHNRIIVFGKGLAQAGIVAILDSLARDPQFRRTNWLLVAENTAQDILQSQTDRGAVPAKEIDRMMIDLTKDAMILPTHLNDFTVGLYSEGETGLVPLVTVAQSGANPSPRIELETTAVFKNNRLIDVLTVEESQGLLWLTDQQKGGLLVFPFQTNIGPKMISVTISNGTSHIRPRITRDGILMEITCTGKGALQETEGLKNTPQTIEQLERSIEEILERRVQLTIKKAQQIKADYLGFASQIHDQYPEQWRRMKREWETEFSRIHSQVRFKIDIISFGLIKDSILKPGQRE